MMRRVWLLVAMLGPFAAVDGQSDSARMASLEARIAKLEQAMGPYGDSIPPSSDFALRCPPLPNQRYSVWCRVQQIGQGIDANNTYVYGLAARLAAGERAIDSVKNVIAGSYGPMIPPFAQGANLVIPSGSLIFGTCKFTDVDAQIKICAPFNATIYMESNQNGGQYQNAATHVAMYGLSSDGGPRITQNGYLSRNCWQDTDPTNGQSYTNCLKKFVDPTREYSLHGPDARGRFSFLMQEPGRAYDYTQNLVLNYYYDQKVLSFESMQAGWIFKFATSSTPRGLEAFYQLPR